MELWLAALILVVATAVSAAGMLILRRRARAGTYLKDPLPAGAVYTVVGTAYMVILAFVFFVAFESYHAAKSAAQDEATATLAMFHAAEPFDPKARAELQGQVMCYAREVISKGWPAMREGHASPEVEARVTAMEQSAIQAPVSGDKQSAAYDQWFALNEDRRRGRQARIAEASPLVPPLIWLILIIGAVVVIAMVGLFANAQETRLSQAVMMGGIAVIVVSGLILVRFLEKPYEDKSGSIEPTAMTRTLAMMQQHEPDSQAVPCT